MNGLGKKAYLTLILFLSAAPLCAQDANFHIYLAFGQSNMDGAGDIEAQDKQGVDPRFKNLSGVTCNTRVWGEWYAANPPLNSCNSGLSPVDYFGRTLIDSLPSEISVGVAMVAVPGAGIDLFDKEAYVDYKATAPSWMQGWINSYDGNPYARLVELGKKAKQVGVIKGILLHQGESNNTQRSWLDKVKKIYGDLMTDLNLDPTQVPLLAGEMVGKDEGGACWGHNGVIADLPTYVANAHIISSSGLAHKGDNLHFSSESYRIFGKRYAETMLTLLDRKPPVIVPAHRDSIFNGSFTEGSTGWTFNVWGGSAQGNVVNEEFKITIDSIGAEIYQIQLVQAGIILTQGKSYKVTFDAYSESPRTLELNVEQDVSPWTSYLDQTQQFNLTSSKQSFSHTFTMNAPTDSTGRITFNAGASVETLYLDNVKIETLSDSVVSNVLFSNNEVKLQLKNSQLFIHWPSSKDTQAEIKLFSIDGTLLQQNRYNLISGVNSIPLNVSIEQGSYLLMVKTPTLQIVRKISNPSFNSMIMTEVE